MAKIVETRVSATVEISTSIPMNQLFLDSFQSEMQASADKWAKEVLPTIKFAGEDFAGQPE